VGHATCNLLRISRKDREAQDADAAAAASNRTLSQLQTSVNIAKQELSKKRAEVTRKLVLMMAR
jgi:DNA repair protein RAD50